MNTLTLDIPVFETERLRFRAMSMDDYDEEVAFYATDRSKGVGGPMTPDQVWRIMAQFLGHWVIHGYGLWALEEKATGRYVGRAGFLNPIDWPEPEIAWTLMEHAEGRGLAEEAARAVRNHAYTKMGWTTAISLIMADNTRSIALAERLGCVRDGAYTHAVHGDVPVWRHPGPGDLA